MRGGTSSSCLPVQPSLSDEQAGTPIPNDPAVAPGRFGADGALAPPVGRWIGGHGPGRFVRQAIDSYQISKARS
jgi:hypothetical protein